MKDTESNREEADAVHTPDMEEIPLPAKGPAAPSATGLVVEEGDDKPEPGRPPDATGVAAEPSLTGVTVDEEAAHRPT